MINLKSKSRQWNKWFIIISLFLIVLSVLIKLWSIVSFNNVKYWNYRQLKDIDTTANTYSFAVLADNKNSITTFNKIIKSLNNKDLAFCIDVGDLVEDGKNEKFRFFLKQIQKINHPFITAIGNHELREEGRTNYYKIFGNFYYSFHTKNAYFIVLDDANEENIEPWQLNWLKDELKKSEYYKYCFLFAHVPLYDPRTEKFKMGHCLTDIAFAKSLNKLLDQYPITMMFCSHIHAYYNGVWGKTPYIITGGAGGELVGNNPVHDFFHYITINVTPEGVSYHVNKIPSPDFNLFDRLYYIIRLYLYSFIVIHVIDIVIILSAVCLLILIIIQLKTKLKYLSSLKKDE